MTQSLRERVQDAMIERMTSSSMFMLTDEDAAKVAETLTTVAFTVMSGARPCVTCGKGIGPANVDRGYVQCYGCARGKPVE